MKSAATTAWCAALLLAAAARAAVAQDAGLTLDAALRQALRKNPGTLLQQQQVEANRGLVLQAMGAFDPVAGASATRGRDYRPLRVDERNALVAAGVTTVNEELASLTSYSVGVNQTIMNGLTLGSAFSVSSVSDRLLNLQDIPRQTSGRLAFTLRAPLLRNAGREAVGATLDAAEAQLAAAQAGLYYTNAQTVLGTALAYWQYVASGRSLAIAKASETRIAALADEVRKLIEADQVPAAELNLVLANLGEKRVTRVVAEQALADARLALARQLGLSGAQANSLASPIEDIPGMDTRALRPVANVDALIRHALERRPDLIAARYAEQAARFGVNAARQNLKPQLDLNLSLAYAGLAQGPGAANFNAAFNSAQVGPSATATLGLQWPWENSAARGTFATQSALFDATSIRLRDLEASVSGSIPVFAGALRRSAEQLEQAAESVRRYASTLENEQTKRRLGTATLIDVINVEDRLNNALLGQVQLRRAYAGAIARLRFELGSIVRRDGDEYTVRLADLTGADFEEETR